MKSARREAAAWLTGLAALCLFSWVGGCQTAPPYTEAPPDWETADGRWWKAGVDTARVFTDLSTFRTMGIEFEEVAFEAARPPEQQPVRMKRKVMNEVQKELLPLYRHRPSVVDSLFEEFVAPEIRSLRAPKQSGFDETVERQTERAYQVLRQHFNEPRTRLTLGEDVPIVYPDSLRSEGTGGRVEMQVYMNARGEPQAVELMNGIHPILDKIALRAATQMRWDAAELEGTPIRCWVRYSIQFTP